MASTWTKAAKVRRAFKAGRQRQKDLKYDCERAVLEARILNIEIRKAMIQAGITTGDDAKVALVLMTPDSAKINRVYVLTIPRDIAGLPEVAAKAAKLEKAEKAVPLGVAIWQRDREAYDPSELKSGIEVWMHLWLTSERALCASAEALKAFFNEEETSDF